MFYASSFRSFSQTQAEDNKSSLWYSKAAFIAVGPSVTSERDGETSLYRLDRYEIRYANEAEC